MMSPDGWGQALVVIQERCLRNCLSLKVSEDCIRRQSQVLAGALLTGFPSKDERFTCPPQDEVWVRQVVEAMGVYSLLAVERVQ